MSYFWDFLRKTATMACQYKPLLLVNNQKIPPAEPDESFKYLGKEFNYKMSTQHTEKEPYRRVKQISYETRLRSVASKAENYSNQQICDQQN